MQIRDNVAGRRSSKGKALEHVLPCSKNGEKANWLGREYEREQQMCWEITEKAGAGCSGRHTEESLL